MPSLDLGKAALVPSSPGLGDLSQKWWTSSDSNSQEAVATDSAECTQASVAVPDSPGCTQASKTVPDSPDCTQASGMLPPTVESSPATEVVPDSVECSPASPPKRRKQALPASLARPYLAFRSRSVAPSRSLVRAAARKSAPGSSPEQRRRRREAALLSGDPVAVADDLQQLAGSVVESVDAFKASLEGVQEVLSDVYAATHELKQTMDEQAQTQAMITRLQQMMRGVQGLSKELRASVETQREGASTIELAVAGARAAVRDQKVSATEQLKVLRLADQTAMDQVRMLRLAGETAALMTASTSALRHMIQRIDAEQRAAPPSPVSPRIPFLDATVTTPCASLMRLGRGTPSSEQPTRVAKSNILAKSTVFAIIEEDAPYRQPVAKRGLEAELAGAPGGKGLYPQARPYVPQVLDFDSATPGLNCLTRTPDLEGLTLDDPAVLSVPPTLYSPGTPPKTLYPGVVSPKARRGLHSAQVSPRPRKAGARRVVNPTSKASFKTSYALDFEDLTPEKGARKADQFLRLPRQPFTPPGPRHPVMRELDTDESQASPVFNAEVRRYGSS
jgi:hypothetical protein